MCGIVGFVGQQDVVDHVVDGLKCLEYRGYDSAGIASIHDGEICVRRSEGKLKALCDLLEVDPLQGSTVIGHTRWATHGAPNTRNAHPHRVDDIVLVHNGIVENFHQLVEQLSAAGRTFESETDSELISHLIAMAPGNTLFERVRYGLQQVRGTYAVAVLSVHDPDTMVVAKHASPLVVGLDTEKAMIASDITALLDCTRHVVVLEDGEFAIVRPGQVELLDQSGQVIDKKQLRIGWTPQMAQKEGHAYFMHKEIFEQSRSVTDTLRGRLDDKTDDVIIDIDSLRLGGAAKNIILTACGTSWHAGLVGRLLLEDLIQIPCQVELASELRYRTPLFGPDSLVVALSQSGETADTIATLHEAKRLGSPVLSVVNVVDSSIARLSDHVFYTRAGPEIGVASTKAFLTQLVAMYLFALGVARNRGVAREKTHELLVGLRQIPLAIERCLQEEDEIRRVAQQLVEARSMLYLGRGYGYPVAYEGALKMKEISYIHAEGYPAGEMKHGPIALLEAGVPVVVIATQGPMYEKVLVNIQEAKARGAKLIAIATRGDTTIANLCDEVLYTPPVEPRLMPLVATVPLQLLAYHVAELRGADVDQPRNLAKSVTVE